MTNATHANVDAAELKKFSNLAYSWWDPTGPLHTLHEINPLRLQFILNHTSLEERHVLDVGCGGGILCEAMAQQKAHVMGIDADEQLIKTANLHLHESKLNIDYKKVLIEDFSSHHQEQFDVVCCMEMLEHVPNPQSIITHIAEVTKKNGFVFLSTLNRTIRAWLFAIVGAEYLLRIIPKGTHRFDQLITPQELHKLSLAANLRLVAMTGLHYDPFFKRHHLSNDLSINYLCCLVKD